MLKPNRTIMSGAAAWSLQMGDLGFRYTCAHAMRTEWSWLAVVMGRGNPGVSVVPAQLSLKAVGKAWLFAALAFQNWSLSCAHRLGPAQARPRLRPCPVGNLSGDFHARTKKNQVTSFGWQRCDNIYICIFNSFSYIYMNLKSLLPCFTI